MKKLDWKIGDKVGNFTILDNRERSYFVMCRCGNKYYMPASQIKRTQSCKRCLGGCIPGKIINGCQVIESSSNRPKWIIKCECGKIFESKITSKKSENLSCGCKKAIPYKEKAKEKIGMKIGKLKVINIEKGEKRNLLVCKCKCGNIVKFFNGHECKRNSCGCLIKDNSVKGEKKGNARFRNTDILAMREFDENQTYTRKEIAEMFEIDTNYLTKILKGHIWKFLPLGERVKERKPRPKGLIYKNNKITVSSSKSHSRSSHE